MQELIGRILVARRVPGEIHDLIKSAWSDLSIDRARGMTFAEWKSYLDQRAQLLPGYGQVNMKVFTGVIDELELTPIIEGFITDNREEMNRMTAVMLPRYAMKLCLQEAQRPVVEMSQYILRFGSIIPRARAAAEEPEPEVDVAPPSGTFIFVTTLGDLECPICTIKRSKFVVCPACMKYHCSSCTDDMRRRECPYCRLIIGGIEDGEF